jgi:hypothetical protein
LLKKSLRVHMVRELYFRRVLLRKPELSRIEKIWPLQTLDFLNSLVSLSETVARPGWESD